MKEFKKRIKHGIDGLLIALLLIKTALWATYLGAGYMHSAKGRVMLHIVDDFSAPRSHR